MFITCYFPQEETGGLLVEVYPLPNKYRKINYPLFTNSHDKYPPSPNSHNFRYYGEGDFYNRPGGAFLRS